MLVREDEPANGFSQVAELSTILGTRFSGRMESSIDELQKFEGAVLRYENQLTEILLDALHQAMLKSNALAPIKMQVDRASFNNASTRKCSWP